jgi:hypothetical protein
MEKAFLQKRSSRLKMMIGLSIVQPCGLLGEFDAPFSFLVAFKSAAGKPIEIQLTSSLKS